MISSPMRLIALLSLLALGLAGCAGPPPAPTTTPAAVAPSPTAPPAAPTPPPATPTAPPATATAVPVPTATPVPSPVPPTARPATPTPVPPTPRPARPPNELGKIMVLEYHWVDDEEARWTRSREGLRRDLEYLYRNGYHLVPLGDLIDNRVRVPAGKSPVVLTFDDSNRTQFQMIVEPDGRQRVDPRSGLGIIEAFLREHPDFGKAAVFCVLPAADPPNDLFGQPELRQAKLRYLVENGYELCNHTWWHQNLRQVDAAGVVKQVALAAKAVDEMVPGYRMRIFSPPMGVYPKDVSLLVEGSFEGTSYRHDAILEVTGGPLTAPNHRETDFRHIPRIQAIPSELDRWFGHFEAKPGDRYVSDGDPDRLTFPAELAADFRAPRGARELAAPGPGLMQYGLR